MRRAKRPAGTGAPGLALRAIDAFEGISGSVLLDRLIRGRLWIGLLAFALIGIVAMQLFVLELNTGIGRTLTHVAALQRENAQLGIEDSTYTAEARVAPAAAANGMVLAPVGAVHFVAASPSDVSRAAAALSTAVQAPSSAALSSTSGLGEASSGEAGTEAGRQASSAQAGAEASGAGAGGEASEPSSSSGPGASAATPSASQATSTNGSTSTSTSGTTVGAPAGAATQTSGASGASSGESAVPSSGGARGGEARGGEASGAGGGTPAGSRE